MVGLQKCQINLYVMGRYSPIPYLCAVHKVSTSTAAKAADYAMVGSLTPIHLKYAVDTITFSTKKHKNVNIATVTSTEQGHYVVLSTNI